MKELNIEQKVLKILREVILKGSRREISLNKPMGEVGLGLDSLALVEFVTLLEDTFNVEFPNKIWTDKDQLTLQKFIEHIEENQQSNAKINKQKMELFNDFDKIPINKVKKALLIIKTNGFGSGTKWLLSYFFYRIERRYILSFDLANNNIPEYYSTLDLKFSLATEENFIQISEIYPKPISIDEFRRRQNSGYLCFLAWHENKVVAFDWIACNEHYDPDTGLTFKLNEKSCYGLELFENKEYKEKGIGLALLAFSLKESKQRGYEKSITWVDSDNLKMLNASIHILGHNKIGEIIKKIILLKSSIKWSINGHTGRGKIVIA